MGLMRQRLLNGSEAKSESSPRKKNKSGLRLLSAPLENREESGRERIMLPSLILLSEFSPSMPTSLLALLHHTGSDPLQCSHPCEDWDSELAKISGLSKESEPAPRIVWRKLEEEIRTALSDFLSARQ
jgi:hypothetical protein